MWLVEAFRKGSNATIVAHIFESQDAAAYWIKTVGDPRTKYTAFIAGVFNLKNAQETWPTNEVQT